MTGQCPRPGDDGDCTDPKYLLRFSENLLEQEARCAWGRPQPRRRSEANGAPEALLLGPSDPGLQTGLGSSGSRTRRFWEALSQGAEVGSAHHVCVCYQALAAS